MEPPGPPQADSLLTTKLFIPPPGPTLVPRERLLARLDEGRRQGGALTLAIAPPGWGKTTVLAAWLAHLATKEGGPTPAWVALDAADNDPARFWTYVLAALRPAAPAAIDPLLALLRSPQPPPVESLLTPLVNALAAPGTPRTILVLDDYHVITAPAIHTALAFLIAHLPPGLHLVLASRADPPLPLGRLRARGLLTELRAADLAFQPAEAAAFLNETMRLALPPAAVAALETRTEGWIAGLQLAALATRDRADAAGFIAGFSGSHRFVVDYLAEEVFERQPPAIQAFLLATGVLDRLTAPLCAALLAEETGMAPDAPAAQVQLEQLDRANLFLIPLDDERRWYRYHHLFADVLRARLRQTHPERLPGLYRRAAAWCAAHAAEAGAELLTEAIGYALLAGDTAYAADLVEANALVLLWTFGDIATVRRWLAMLPEAVNAGRVLLCLTSAQVGFVGGDLAGLANRVAQARRALDSLPDPPAEWEAGVTGSAGWVAILQGDFAGGRALLEQAIAALPTPSLNRSLILHALGEFYLRGGNHTPAAPLFAELAEASRAGGFPILAISGLSGLIRCRIFDARLHEAEAICRDGLRLAEQHGVHGGLTVANLHWMLAMIYYEWNDLTAAEQHARTACEISRLGSYDWLRMAAALTLAQTLLAGSDAGGARAALDESMDVARRLDYPRALAQAEAIRLPADLASGAPPPDPQPFERALALDLAGQSDPVFAVEPGYYAPLQVLLRVPDSQSAARDLPARLLAAEEARGRTSRVIALLALQGQSLAAAGRAAEARVVLERAHALGAPGGYLRTFLDAAGEAAPGAPQPPAETLAEPLTEREIEVLRLIAAGASNREIAGQLIVSLGTVKKHTNNIFGKLGVASRTQAIVRARALGLVP